MVIRRYISVLTVVICFALSAGAAVADDVTPAVGGFPEYLFLEKVSEAEAPKVAYLLALTVEEGRAIIFQNLPKIFNPELGDKGFTPEFFEQKLLASLKQETKEMSDDQRRIFDKFMWAAKQSIALNQDRINVKGVKFKYFLPATWSRETALMLKTKTGIMIKQAAINYRSPCNKADAMENTILTKFRKPDYDGKTYGEMSTVGKQKVYRHFRPVTIDEGCLGCHGEPKGEKDIIGYEKDGLKIGDVRAIISVTVPVK